MSSASSSTTAGSNTAAAANQSGQQAGGAGGSASGNVDGSAGGDNHGAVGNVVQPQQATAGGTTEPPTSTSSSAAASHHRGGPTASGTTGSMGTVLRRKTNVCLICGIYTNLSLNIFEPRNGPNIVDVIYEKYKFRAERGDNADKHICFSCNNWLINWYSLQNTSSGSSRTYEPAPSTSRSSSSAAADSSNNRHRGKHHQGHKSRTKRTIVATRGDSFTPNDKENCPTKSDAAEQHDQVSSTTPSYPAGQEEVLVYGGLLQTRQQGFPYAKRTKRRPSPIAFERVALRESNGNLQQRLRGADKPKTEKNSVPVVSSSTPVQQRSEKLEPFESLLIQMLAGQGTSVTKESVRDGDEADDENKNPPAMARWHPTSKESDGCRNLSGMRHKLDENGNSRSLEQPISDLIVLDEDDQCQQEDEDDRSEIVLSFDSALSEVIDVVPSLKALQTGTEDDNDSERHPLMDPVGPLRQRLSSGVLSMSIISVRSDHPNNINW